MTTMTMTILCVSAARPRDLLSNPFPHMQGPVGQDSLSTMIRKDELGPARTRRRFYDVHASYQDTTGKLTYPAGE